MANLPPARPGSDDGGNGGPEGTRDASIDNRNDPGETSGPYARSAGLYLAAGWSPLPVVGKHVNLPAGYTGETGKGASASDVALWVATRGTDNVALRLPLGVVGIDVDNYAGKDGLATLRALVTRLGPLPSTWSSTARGAGWSRQLLYRTPPAALVRLPGVLGPGVEVIQRHHRYTVAWPSVHPDTGETYRWYAPDASLAPDGVVPRVEDLAPLPEAWWEAVPAGGEKGGSGAGWTNPDVDRLLMEGVPAGAVQDDVLRDLVWRLVLAGQSDQQIQLQWLAVVSRTPVLRAGEPWTADDFRRHLRGARAKLGAGGQAVTVGEVEREWVSGQVAASGDGGAPAAPVAVGADQGPGDGGLAAGAGAGAAGGAGVGAGAVASGGDGERPDLSGDLTGTGNAHRLLDLLGDELRHVTGMGWLTWDDGVWRRDDRQRALDLTERLVTRCRAEWQAVARDPQSTKGLIREYLAHYQRTASLRGRTEAMAIAAAHPRVALTAADLDPDPWALRVANGTLELRIGSLRPSAREDRHSRQAAVRFDPSGVCPQFEAFITDALPDPAVRAYVQRICGYVLTGDVSEQAFFFLFGVKGAGKSTLCEVLRLLLGDYGQVADDSLLYKTDGVPTNLVDLLGKRLVVHDELSRTRKLDTARINQFTSSKVVQGRRMRQDFIDVPVTFKLLLTSNQLPGVGGSGVDGVWRRMKLLTFTVPVKGERVKDYAAKLVDEEGPGILNWCLAGLRGYLELEGLGEPSAVSDAVSEYQEDEDVLEQFTSLFLVRQPGAWLAHETLMELYLRWCKENGHRPEDGRVIGKALRTGGWVPAKPCKARRMVMGGGVETRTHRGWLDVTLDVSHDGGFVSVADDWTPVNAPKPA